MADTNRHDAQVHRHEHTHVTQNLCMASRGSTWTLATTRAPPRRREPCPPGAGSAAGCCASARHRPVRGGRALAQTSPYSGGAGRLAAASWAR
jgi:hypothetical protein